MINFLKISFVFTGVVHSYGSLGADAGVRFKPKVLRSNPVFMGPRAFSTALVDPRDDQERPFSGRYSLGGLRGRNYIQEMESGNDGDDEDDVEMDDSPTSPTNQPVPESSPPPTVPSPAPEIPTSTPEVSTPVPDAPSSRTRRSLRTRSSGLFYKLFEIESSIENCF